ncbi:porin family protein [Candidatus Symbiothrix dinenymphae]|uniref:porin family protein n=1 Tax=Candidatus Symbiothrix dinenymphae TaxID=467085 RepID=UPI0006C22D51|nr:porin family protein [Candidatus Symbiothrix dinenymphae]GAP73410.1 hypothetical protein SAMD00024442_9_8 [Candidatus Symbiothrix dinenymphae]
MKKIVFLSAIALVSVASVNAQELKFGVTAGLNLPSFSGDLGEGMVSTIGFQVGAVADVALTESFSIVPELLFTQKGAAPVMGDAITLGYLQLPINAMYKIAVNDNSKVLVFAGPYIGYGITSSDDGAEFGSDKTLNPLDFGLNIGAGYQFGSIFAKAQYNIGLTNVANEGKDGGNSNIAITVGYLF